MFPLPVPGPQRVGPAPQVLRAIRNEMRQRGLGPRDRRMPAVSASLAAEPVQTPGWNAGIFYPPQEAMHAPGARLAPSAAVRRRQTTGTLRCLVLLVDFDDNRGTRDPAEFREMLFGKKTYRTGSMYDFYLENSFGKLKLEGDVVGWLRLPQPYSYYVNGDNGGGAYPTNGQRMAEDALSVAMQQLALKDFDADGDGFLDGLFVVHAGDGAEADPDTASRAKKMWSHQWNMSKTLEQGGVKAYAYCTEPEDGRVGVFCHEFGHMLGLPDLYDTTYRSEGVGAWCVMGAGSWNNGGLTPGHFCAWAKARLGWTKPTVVKKAQALTLPAAATDPKGIYRLWTKGKAGDEYFLIENRQRTGFDAKLPAEGLVIWKIDDSQHNNDHPGAYWVAVRQADGRNDLELARNRGDDGDPFPGRAKNTKFDDASTPNAHDGLDRPTGVAVTNIAVSGNAVKCKVKV